MCRCRIADWRRFRVALGLTQRAMGELLSLSERAVQYLEERDRHRCPYQASITVLRYWLRATPEYRQRLHAAGLAYPYPEDLEVLA